MPSGLPFGFARPKGAPKVGYGRPDNKPPLLQGNPSAAKAQPSPAIFHLPSIIEGSSLSVIGYLWLIVRVVYIQHTFAKMCTTFLANA